MRKQAVFFTLSFLLMIGSSLQESKASFSPADPLQELAQQLKSPDDIARFIWRHFSFESDQTQFGKEDYWQSPSEILKTQKGDCEDFAGFANELLKRNGKTSFLLNLYGGRYSHTVCVFKENGRYSVIDGANVVHYNAENLRQLVSEIYPFWQKSAIVVPSSISNRGKILAQFEKKLEAQRRLSTSV